MSNTPFMVKGKPFFPIGGQTKNSSSQNAADMADVWDCTRALHGNSIASPVFWEMIEPVEGQFDFSQVDMLIRECRANDMKLVILWFGTWKNAASQYVPEWVKTNKERFVYCLDVQGAMLRVLSPVCEETRKADAKAFKAMMQHIREVDENEQTVIAVQVENEAGIFGTMRDYSPMGQKAYGEQVPQFIMEGMKKLDQNALIYKRWQEAGGTDKGTWEECFGHMWGGEFFSAYWMASYISSVAKAGKEAYNLPMYVNIWLSDIMYEIPGIDYPAGICGSHLLDYWKWCGPDIDFISPDHYLADMEQYEKVCAAYSRPDNYLYIPESSSTEANALNIFRAIGRYDCVGIHCFGIDGVLLPDGRMRPGAQTFADSLKVVSSFQQLLHKYRGTDKLYTVAQEEFATTARYDFGQDYIGVVRFYSDNGNDTQGVSGVSGTDKYHNNVRLMDPDVYKSPGRGFIVYDEGVFYIAGVNFRLEVIRRDDVNNLTSAVRSEAFMFSRHLEFLRVEEGHFDENGNWKVDRARTGDEADNGIWVAPDVGVVKLVMDMTK